jgi:hypothetical protein
MRVRVVSFLGLCFAKPKHLWQSSSYYSQSSPYYSEREHNCINRPRRRRRRRTETVRLGNRRPRLGFRFSRCCVKWISFVFMVKKLRKACVKMMSEVASLSIESSTVLVNSHWAFPLVYPIHCPRL